MTAGWYTPTLPSVLVALPALWRGWPALAGVELRDGPSIANSAAPQVLACGWTGPDNDADADGSFAQEGMGPRDREHYSVHNAASVLNGDGDLAAAVARASEIWTQAYAAVYIDNTLGHLVQQAVAGAWSLRRDLTDAGAVATFTFDIDIDAYTRP